MSLKAFSLTLKHAWALGKTCQDCSTNIPTILEKTRFGILCRACRLKRYGLKPFEKHHLLGRDIPITITIPANLHATLTAYESVYGKTFGLNVILLWLKQHQTMLLRALPSLIQLVRAFYALKLAHERHTNTPGNQPRPAKQVSQMQGMPHSSLRSNPGNQPAPAFTALSLSLKQLKWTYCALNSARTRPIVPTSQSHPPVSKHKVTETGLRLRLPRFFPGCKTTQMEVNYD